MVKCSEASRAGLHTLTTSLEQGNSERKLHAVYAGTGSRQ